MLINQSMVKEFALDMAKGRAHKFTRVSGEFLAKCEGHLKAFIRQQVHSVPSKGKTIR